MASQSLNASGCAVSADRTTPIGLALRIIAFALLTAIAAQVRVPIPGTPVPLTLQLPAVLLAGVCLSPVAATGAMALYIGAGLSGMPVWSPGSAGLLGVTGGYIIGFVLAAPTVALLRAESGNAVRLALAVAAGATLVLAAGVIWQSFWLKISIGDAVRIGAAPFVLKAAVESGLLASGVCAVRRLRPRAKGN